MNINTCSDFTQDQSPGVRCMAGRPTAKKADRQLSQLMGDAA